MNKINYRFLMWLLFMVAILPSAFATKTNPENKAVVTFDKKNNRLSVKAHNATLLNLLTQVSKQTGIKILFDPEADGKVSAAIKNQPLEKVLQRLLKTKSYIFIYGDPSDSSIKNSRRIKTVKVLPKGKEDSSQLVAIQHSGFQYVTLPEGVPMTNKRMKGLQQVNRHRLEATLKREANREQAKALQEKARARIRTHERGSGQGEEIHKKKASNESKELGERQGKGWSRVKKNNTL